MRYLIQSGEQTREHIETLANTHGGARQTFGQQLAFDILEHEKGPPRLFAHIKNGNDVGMNNPADGTRFPKKIPLQCTCAVQRTIKMFDSHLTLQFRIDTEVDGSLISGTEFSGDLEAP